MVGDSLTGAGKRPSRDHDHKVLAPNGKNGNNWLARLMPCAGKWAREVVCFLGSVLKGITGVWGFAGCGMCIAP